MLLFSCNLLSFVLFCFGGLFSSCLGVILFCFPGLGTFCFYIGFLLFIYLFIENELEVGWEKDLKELGGGENIKTSKFKKCFI